MYRPDHLEELSVMRLRYEPPGGAESAGAGHVLKGCFPANGDGRAIVWN